MHYLDHRQHLLNYAQACSLEKEIEQIKTRLKEVIENNGNEEEKKWLVSELSRLETHVSSLTPYSLPICCQGLGIFLLLLFIFC
jgi:hypothetical protein